MLASNCLEKSSGESLGATTALRTAHSESSGAEIPAATAESQSGRRFSLSWEYVAIFVIILLISGIRFRLRDFPLERDEGEYAYAGQLILRGVPPYQLAYNMKLPGTYAAYAVIMAVFGQTTAGIHLGVIVVNSGCIFLVFLIARRLMDPLAGVVAGATFGLFTIRPMLLGLAGHATHFVALAALASLYLLLKATGTNRYWLFFWSGIGSGLALVMKQPGVFFGIFAGLYLIWSEWPEATPRRAFWQKLGSFSMGAILPYALTCVILFEAGVFQKFWFWTVSYARAYGAEIRAFDGTRLDGLHQFANRMELQKEHVGLLWWLIVFGMTAFLWEKRLRAHAVFVLGLLAFSFLAISVGFYYRGHYFIMAYPVLGILAGASASALREFLLRLRLRAVAAAAGPITLFGLVFANAVYADREVYLFDTPHDACRFAYGANPFPEAVGVGNYIRRHSTPDTRVAVLGSEPEIYFYAQRLSATGYIYTYPLVEEQEYGSIMQGEMIKEIETVKPNIFVYALTHESWLTKAHADQRIFDWIGSYVKEHYTLEGIADGGNQDIYRWGPDAATYRPRRPEVILVYRRW